MTKRIVVLGATSAIAQSVCATWASRGYILFLVARNANRLRAMTSDLTIRFQTTIYTAVADFNHENQLIETIHLAKKSLGSIDYAFIAYGILPNQIACEESLNIAKQSLHTNGTSIFIALMAFSKIMSIQKQGIIGVITSVAGDRGRANNFIYGMSKGMIQICLSGLRAKLRSDHVFVLDIRPGFVNTPMTKHIEKKGFLWAQPQQIANDIVIAFDKKKYMIYTPYFWRWIMFIIKSLPIFIFNRLKI